MPKPGIVIRCQMSDENLFCHFSSLLDQAAELGALHTVRHRMNDRTQLTPVAIWDVFEYLCVAAFLEGVVRCLKHNGRISHWEVARVRNDPGVVKYLNKC